MKTYTAVARRSNGWWSISVPELKGVHSQARRLDQVADSVREAIALFLDAPSDSFGIEVRPDVPRAVSYALVERQAAKEADRRAEAATAGAVAELLAEGYTLRDAGALLGLSPQRVSQISGTIEHARAS